MNTKAFVYLWYDAPNKKYYLGWHKGTPDDKYTHSSTVWESFTKNTIPEGVTRRILTYGTDVDMANLEHKLLKNRKKRCWNRYYNKSVGDPNYVILSGEDHPMFGRTGEASPRFGMKHTPETLKKMSEARRGENHYMFGKKASLETRKKLSEARRGEKNPNFGKKASLESLKKMSEAKRGDKNPNFGKKPKPESLKKMSEAKSGENNPNSRKNREARREKAERLKSA